MATTVRFGDGEREKIEKGYIGPVGMDLWYKVSPFWYKHNRDVGDVHHGGDGLPRR